VEAISKNGKGVSLAKGSRLLMKRKKRGKTLAKEDMRAKKSLKLSKNGVKRMTNMNGSQDFELLNGSSGNLNGNERNINISNISSKKVKVGIRKKSMNGVQSQRPKRGTRNKMLRKII
jgi:hypothetical protein